MGGSYMLPKFRLPPTRLAKWETWESYYCTEHTASLPLHQPANTSHGSYTRRLERTLSGTLTRSAPRTSNTLVWNRVGLQTVECSRGRIHQAPACWGRQCQPVRHFEQPPYKEWPRKSPWTWRLPETPSPPPPRATPAAAALARRPAQGQQRQGRGRRRWLRCIRGPATTRHWRLWGLRRQPGRRRRRRRRTTYAADAATTASATPYQDRRVPSGRATCCADH
jgi:hypothetical protein